MAARHISRRSFLNTVGLGAAGAGVTFYGPWKHNHVYAAKADKPLLIGFTTDASGQYGNSGEMERRGMLMAISEFNKKGGVLGRQVETIHIDTETTPATGTRVAERMITRHEVAFLMGAVSSGVANAISLVAQRYGVVYFNTNSSSPTESGKDCHRVKFVWDGNGTNFGKATVLNAINAVGKNWVLFTNDYVWGHETSKSVRALVTQYGGKIVEEMIIPVGTRDFSSYLLKLQQIKPDVVNTAVGGDDIKALRAQVGQLGMGKTPAWVQNQQDWPDVYGLPLSGVFGIFGTTWYYKLDLPGVKEFVAQYRKMYPGVSIKVPGNVYYNGYMATLELLRAVERVGSTNNIKVIKELEILKVSAKDRIQHFDAYMNPTTHQMQQTVYLATANDEAAWKKDNDDLFKVLAWSKPQDVEDTDAPKACKMESYEATPSYEM
jgi:branched-chain amino acid transport system substrate-binding protein